MKSIKVFFSLNDGQWEFFLIELWETSLILIITNLMGLQLQNNSLTSLPMEIGQLTKLTKLNLSRNKLETLPEGIYKLTELRHLNMSFNSIQEISESIAELNMLEKLVKLLHA
jgi:Leucine-rich repeat (LRR) protein